MANILWRDFFFNFYPEPILRLCIDFTINTVKVLFYIFSFLRLGAKAFHFHKVWFLVYWSKKVFFRRILRIKQLWASIIKSDRRSYISTILVRTLPLRWMYFNYFQYLYSVSLKIKISGVLGRRWQVAAEFSWIFT